VKRLPSSRAICARRCRRTAAYSATRNCSTAAVTKVKELEQRMLRTAIKDKSRTFNTARVEALELDNLIETAKATVVSAAARHEFARRPGAQRLSRT